MFPTIDRDPSTQFGHGGAPHAEVSEALDGALPFRTQANGPADLTFRTQTEEAAAEGGADRAMELSPTTCAPPDAKINRALFEHTTSAADWPMAHVVEDLYQWFGRLNDSFFRGELPLASISIDHGPRKTLGTYRPGRDGLALRYRINLNSRHIGRGAAARVATLAHEMIHQWEEITRGRGAGSRYHTCAFRRKAEEIGVPTDEVGHDLGLLPDGQLARLLRHHEIPLAEDRSAAGKAAEGSSAVRRGKPTMVKWRCECTTIWASRSVVVEARCRRCLGDWQRQS